MDNTVSEAVSSEQQTGAEKGQGFLKTYARFKKIVGAVVMFFYNFRRVFMAVPVVYYALKLATYNMSHLPEEVGIFLQNNGEFLQTVSKGTAVTAPLAITGICLALMFFCRKAMYSWAVSIFTLALPILLLVSNTYPA